MSYRDTNEDNYARNILQNADEANMQNVTEIEYLRKYKNTLHALERETTELSRIKHRLRELSSGAKVIDSVEIEELQESKDDIETLIPHYEKYLQKLETTPPLMYVLERESVQAYLKEKEKEAEEIIRQYDEKRQKNLLIYNEQRQVPKERIEKAARLDTKSIICIMAVILGFICTILALILN